MNSLDWDKEFNHLMDTNGCSDSAMAAPSKGLLRKRKALEAAFKKVQKTAENYPNVGEKEFRARVYSNTSSVLLSIIVFTLISTAVRMLIEYLIKKLYSEK